MKQHIAIGYVIPSVPTTRDYVNKIQNAIEDTFYRDKTCASSINPAYLASRLPNAYEDDSANHVYIVSGTSRGIHAFLIGRIVKNRLHVDILCSNKALGGSGAVLLRVAAEFAKEHGLRGVSLRSMNHVRSYYKKLGFSNHQSRDKNGWLMTTNV